MYSLLGGYVPNLLLATVVPIAELSIANATVFIKCTSTRRPSNLHDALGVQVNLAKESSVTTICL